MKSGIYCFESISNSKKYIGLSKNVYSRRDKHIRELKKGVHYNAHLQAHFNKYGEKDLKWIVLEFCENALLSDKEKEWIEKFDSHKNGFNATEGGRGQSRGDFCRRAKFENIHTGEIIECRVIDLRDRLVKEGNSYEPPLYDVLNGKAYSRCGWKLAEGGDYRKTNKRPITLINEFTGEILSADSMNAMAEILGVNPTAITNVKIGKNHSIKGFVLPSSGLKEKLKLQNQTTGEIKEAYTVQKLAEMFGVDSSYLCKIKGGQKSKKWRFICPAE